MRKLKVDWNEFDFALSASGEMAQGYVDLKSGRAFVVHEETQATVQELIEGCEDDQAIEAAIVSSTAEPMEQQSLRDAAAVEMDSEDIVTLDRDEFRETYHDLVDFTATVTDASVRSALEKAIDGPGAFRRFRQTIDQCFRERKQWFAFREERMREKATEWFAGHGIAVEWILPHPPPTSGPAPRQHLLQGVRAFVDAASRLPGVKKIALIGSLTRDQPDPKDADLLVTVADDMDLTPLAKAGRKLAGHAQQQGRGADVFLANERGEYIGRTCPWRDCAPGIRVRCGAQHCGRRHFLHDDLESVRLDRKLVAEPPVELWPEVHARVAVPADVEAEVLAQLRHGR